MSEETKEYIINKAQSLFYNYGIRSITMDFIASELGMSKRTLYENFKNKDALIKACLEQGRKAQERDMCDIISNSPNTIEMLARCYNRIIYYINQTSRSFQLDIKQMNSRLDNGNDNYREKQFQYIRNILSKGVEEGLIRSDLDLDIVTSLHNGQIMWIHETPEYQDEVNVANTLSVYTKIFLYGIVTEKGKQILDKAYENFSQTL